MDTIQRYLQAIEFWLPKNHKRDIIAEIADDIQSAIDERESALGRKLDAAALEALIQHRGSPLLVANRYLPQRYLIGPVLFPVYVFVLRIYALCGLPLWCLGFVSALRLQNPALSWPEIAGTVLSSLWSTAFLAFGTITLAFAILQRVEMQTHFLERWNPKKLPPVRSGNTIPLTSSAAEALINLAIAIWWCFSAWSPDVFGLHIVFRPLWALFFWGFLAAMLSNCVIGVLSFVHPHWTRPRAMLRLSIDTAAGVLFAWLLKANLIAAVAVAGASPLRDLQLRDGLQWWLDQLFPYAVLIVVITLCIDLYRVFRSHRKDLGLLPQAAVV